LKEDLIVDFIGQITYENVEVVGGVFLVRGVRLVRPVDADFLNTNISDLKMLPD
jgi:hypothetical protein